MRKAIPVRESIERWRKDPDFRQAYDALDEEFALAEALIRARSGADLSQEQLAERMNTSQSTVARLEGGRANPSLKTLHRLARATRTRLRIAFEPIDRPD